MHIPRSERPYLAGFIGALLLMIAGAVMFAVSYRSGAEAGEWVDHARRAIAEIDSAHVDVNVAVESAWQFRLGNHEYAAEYERSLQRVIGRIERLQLLAREHPEQRQRARHLAELAETVGSVSLEDAWLNPATPAPTVLLEEIRTRLREMTTVERTLLTGRIEATRDASLRQLIIMLLLIGLALITTTVLFYALRRDLVKRRQTERALRDSEQRLLAIIDAAPNAVVTLDPDGLVTGWNPRAEKLFGWQRSEVVGERFEERIVADNRERLLTRVAAVSRRAERRGTAESRQRIRARTRGGDEIPVELTLNGTLDQGRVRLTAFLDDLTAREQTRIALSQARDAAIAASGLKSEFLAHISHELRTPLNGIIGMAGLLRDTDLDEEQAEFAETIRKSGEHLLSIINDLLDLSKIEAGKLLLETADFDLEQATRDVTDLLLPAARDKDTELVVSVAPDVPRFVRGDVGRLRQILLNLVGNAVKFTASGHVLIRITRVARVPDGVTLHFAVSDTGIGIPQEHQHRLFRSFEQGEVSTSRRFGGTGLGLALSRQLVERMGGRIGFESTEGKGSTFWFELPLGVAPEAETQSMPDLSEARVLVVEDNEAARASLEEILTSWRMSFHSEANAADALRAFEAARAAGQPFGFVLVDSTLPDVSPHDLARSIRAVAEGRPHLLLLSASGGRSATPLDADSPFDGVVPKPIQTSDLLDRMASAHGGHESGTGARDRREPIRALFPGARVLLAEDNQVNQKVAGRLLERLGCRVDIAANGREAVDMRQNFPYDLVLMDCQMPEMDGFQATAEIRAWEQEAGRERMPIVALTAHAMAGDRERCIIAGMDDYLTKPVRPEALASALDRFLHGAKRMADVPSAAAGEGRVVDEEQTISAVDGDAHLLVELIRIFEDSSREYLDAIRAARAGGNAAGLARAAHALRGSAANFRATRTCELARELEETALTAEPERIDRLVKELEEAVPETIEALRDLAERLSKNAPR